MIDELTPYFYGALYNFARCYGLLALLPFGTLLSATGLKLVFAVSFSCLFCDTIVPSEQFSLLRFSIEFLLGVALTLPLLVLVEFMCGFGEIVDNMRGQTIALQYSPLASGIESVSAQILRPYLWCLLLYAGFFEQLALLTKRSLLNINFDLNFVLNNNLHEYFSILLSLLVESGTAGFKIFLPVACAILAVDLLFSAIQTILPQASFVNEVFIVKSLLAGYFVYLLADQQIISDWVLLALKQPDLTLQSLIRSP